MAEWIRSNGIGPLCYVKEDCSILGHVQHFYMHCGVGPDLTGYQVYVNHKELARFTTEQKAKTWLETQVREAASGV